MVAGRLREPTRRGTRGVLVQYVVPSPEHARRHGQIRACSRYPMRIQAGNRPRGSLQSDAADCHESGDESNRGKG